MNRIQRLRNKLKTARPNSTDYVDILNELLIELLVQDVDEAERMAKESAALSKKLKYDKGLCSVPIHQAAIFFNKGRPDKAKVRLQEALEIAESGSFEREQSGAYFLLGLIEWSFGKIEKGFECEQKALQLSRKSQYDYIEGWARNALGGFYYDLGDYKSSLEHFKQAWSILNEIKSTEGAARALNGIGNNHLLMGNPQKALQYQKRCLKTIQSTGVKQVEARALFDLGNIYRELGNQQEAAAQYRKSLDMRRAIGQIAGEITTLLYLAELLIEMNELEESRKLSEEALKKATKVNARPKICKAHENMSEIFTALGQFEDGLIHYKKFHELEKEIYHEAADKKLKHLEAVHQLERSTKEAEIHKLRNVDLKNKNKQLKKLLSELQAAQTQLVYSEKMAAIGKLVAGIAHEINNPIGAISGTNQVTERCVEMIEQAVDTSAAKEELAASESYQKAMTILKQNGGIITNASGRIDTIVGSLKNFARLDEAEFQKADIHEGIENTLTLLAHELRDGIEIIKDYGKLPRINCYPSQLNQVFMSLLSNAVEAMDAAGTIHIKTFKIDDQINIEICDNGRGIPKERLKRLFDFDFSSSGSRVKMGAGLVTAHNIIENHKGKIAVKSKVGYGSTFTISLPVNPTDGNPASKTKEQRNR